MSNFKRLVSAAVLPVAGWLVSASMPLAAKHAAPVFETDNYHLRIRVPRTLFACLPSKNAIGSDHGRTFYITQPHACDRDGGALDPQLPSMQVYYGYNVAELAPPRGLGMPPQSDAELAQLFCPDSAERMQIDLRLLGRQATVCRSEDGTTVTISALALYAWNTPDGRGNDADLVITLKSGGNRLKDDLVLFRQLVESAQVITKPVP